MASVNPLSRELVFKIVYYGPGLGGKTTTLEYLHNTTKPEHRGKLLSLATPVDRTLYFDFLPVRLPPIRGMNIRLQLFTVPGQVYFNATRKLVLTGADGIVFVSDSQIARADANIESLENLHENLTEQGRDLSQIPLILQHNKRDLPDLHSIEELDEMLNPFDAFSIPTSARTGLGIYEGLEKISALVLRAFEEELPDELASGFAPTFNSVEGGIATALRDLSPTSNRPAVIRVTGHESNVDAWSSLDTGVEDSASSDLPPSDDMDLPRLPSALPIEDRSLSHAIVPQPDRSTAYALPQQPVEATTTAEQKGLSFATLWPKSEREMVISVEVAIVTKEYAAAVQACDSLVERMLSSAADLFGSSRLPRDPAVVPLLLGLDGRRYLGFRSLVLKARSEMDMTLEDALKAFAFAIDARLMKNAIG